MRVSCYSQRILNPFRGAMNVITTGEADAVTTDGINWSLYIHDTFDAHTDEPEEFSNIEMPELRFGEWNKNTGLKRAPALPSYHYDEIQARGKRLMQAIHKHADHIPFKFTDMYELWLLDEHTHEPLALLDSVCNKNEMHNPGSLHWKAGIRCREYFTSNVMPATDGNESHADLLNQLVNARAGKNPGAQWFLRKENGYGSGLNILNLDDSFIGRELSPRLFPRMLVEQLWNNESDAALFEDFITWLSPWLLLLDFLKDSQRQNLETLARNQALLVDQMHLLYPKIINKKDINAARVEAALRKSVSDSEDNKELLYFVDYDV
jgi:hypothetical protein